MLEQLQYASTSTSALPARTTATSMRCAQTHWAASRVLANPDSPALELHASTSTSALPARTTATSMGCAQTHWAASRVLALLVSAVLERRALVQQAMQPQVLEQLQYASTSTSAVPARTTAPSMGCAQTQMAASRVLALGLSSVLRAFVHRVIQHRALVEIPFALILMSAKREPIIVRPQKFAPTQTVDLTVNVQGLVLKEMPAPARKKFGEIQLRLLVLLREFAHHR